MRPVALGEQGRALLQDRDVPRALVHTLRLEHLGPEVQAHDSRIVPTAEPRLRLRDTAVARLKEQRDRLPNRKSSVSRLMVDSFFPLEAYRASRVV